MGIDRAAYSPTRAAQVDIKVLLPIPVDGDDDTVDELKGDIGNLKGKMALIEDGSWNAASEATPDYRPRRIGADPPDALIKQSENATAEVYAACGINPALFRDADDLSKELPRIPMAPDFFAFANAGRSFAALHLGYETCEEYPLVIESEQPGEPRPEHYRISERTMRYADKEEMTILVVNDHIRVSGIPAEAHRYEVNGRTPLAWFIDRYRIKRDTKSGIVNDPNEWFKDPRDLIPALRRIVHLSVETVRIVEHLPEPFQPEQMDLSIKG